MREIKKVELSAVSLGIALAVVVAAGGYGVYKFFAYADSTQEQLDSLNSKVSSLDSLFSQLAQNNNFLQEALQNEQQRRAVLEATLEDVSGDLGAIKKLQEIDPEILKKYSKVFFLSDNYVPSDLANIPERYLFEEKNPEEIHTKVLPFISDMIRAADRNGIDLKIISAYRSFGEQVGLKSTYRVLYGAGTANSFSAEQGYSEHQLGTTVDFTVEEVGGNLDGFEKSDAYEWLTRNAHNYGFVLSYPPDNNYYVFEPWHWRFVGKELARDLDNDDLYLYDMPQRDIDEYLITVFDR
ncbi:MAG: D-alanyl-D-alanine carboxypeptidase family protein [Candidatus Colwellbacteria bacterium]|nr:D-alanyl-D-alanine carboxypeptidase family protein [Candidatus Colwellbacteria bacterium]